MARNTRSDVFSYRKKIPLGEVFMQEASFTRLNHNYIAGMRPILRKNALYTDTTANYITPAQPMGFDQVQIRFRT